MIVQSKISQKFRHSGLDLKRGRNEIAEPMTPQMKRIIEALARSKIITIGEQQDEPARVASPAATAVVTARAELASAGAEPPRPVDAAPRDDASDPAQNTAPETPAAKRRRRNATDTT